jgi:cystathionine gamma-synthase
MLGVWSCNWNQPERMPSKHHLATTCLHADTNHEERKRYGHVVPPIHVTTQHELDDLAEHEVDGENANTRSVEMIIGELEGGTAVMFANGLSTVGALLHYLKPTTVYIAKTSGYFGVHDVFEAYEKLISSYSPENTGPVISIHDISTLNDFDFSVAADTQSEKETIIWLETPKNPKCDLEDIAHYAKIGSCLGAYVIVDSTFATPVLQKPISFGADFVMHSATKFLAGHSDALAGVVVCNEQHANELRKQRSIMGNIVGNMEAWLLLRSLRTLEVRVLQHSKSAEIVASWLSSQIQNKETNKHVLKVWHPTLKDSYPEQYDLMQRQMGGRGPGIISIEMDSSENAVKLTEKLKVVTNAVSLGGVESLVDWRYRWDKHVPEGLVRLSIGLEHVDDIIQDLKSALLAI